MKITSLRKFSVLTGQGWEIILLRSTYSNKDYQEILYLFHLKIFSKLLGLWPTKYLYLTESERYQYLHFPYNSIAKQMVEFENLHKPIHLSMDV